MKKAGLLAIFVVVVAVMVTSTLFIQRAGRIVTPSVTPKKTVSPPGIGPAALFFGNEPYEKRISLLMPEVTVNLLKFRDQFELKSTLTTYDVLKPIWNTGNRFATVHIQVKDYPVPGSLGLASIKMTYIDDEWRLNLFGGETSFVYFMTNCLKSPIGSVITYFATENAIARKTYIFEEALKSLDPADINPLPESVPFSQWMLAKLISVETEGVVSKATVILKSLKGIERKETVTLRKLMSDWFYYRGDAEEVE